MPRERKRQTYFVVPHNISVDLPLVSTAVPLVSGVLPRMGAEIPLVTKKIGLVSGQIPLLSGHLPVTLPRHWGFLPSRQWARTGLPTERKVMVTRPRDVGGILGKLLTAPIQPLVRLDEVHRVETRPCPGLVYSEKEKQEALFKELELYKKKEPKFLGRARKDRERGTKPQEIHLKEFEEYKKTEPSLFRRSRKGKERGANHG